MILEEVCHRAERLGIKQNAGMSTPELIRAIQSRQSGIPCFDQQWCRPHRHHECPWRHDCHARLESVRGLILSDDVDTGHRIMALLGSSYDWKMQAVHNNKQAFSLILHGDTDVVVADIDVVDLGGLAVLAYAKHRWPSVIRYAITRGSARYLKRLARHIGGCEGIFHLRGIDAHTGLDMQLERLGTENDAVKIS